MDELDQLIKPLILQDLRTQLRARGVNPAGGATELKERLKENMQQTGNYSLHFEGGGQVQAGTSTADMNGRLANNYNRPGGQQNVGNFITDKPSSRVLAPPGGNSQISFGNYGEPQGQPQAPSNYQFAGMQQQPMATNPSPYGGSVPPYGVQPQQQQQMSPQQGGSPYGASSADTRHGALANNYSRPGGQQNVGNFITDRPSSRVLAPPGGKSQISFG